MSRVYAVMYVLVCVLVFGWTLTSCPWERAYHSLLCRTGQGKSSFYQPVPEHILETPVGFLGKYLFSTRERSGQPLGCEGKGCTEKPLSSAGGGRRRFGGEGEEPGEEVTAPADAPFGGPCAVEQSLARPP